MELTAVLLLTVQLLTAGPALLLADDCGPYDTVSVEVTVSARRNATGHWAVNATSTSSAAGLEPAAQPQMSLNARLTAPVRVCSGRGSDVTLSASTQFLRTHVPGYEYFPGLGYYRLVTSATGWVNAQRNCSADGGYLIVINSEREADVLREFYSRGFKAEGAADLDWINVGFHDRYKEGEYMTVLGGLVKDSGYDKMAPDWKNRDDWDCGAVDRRVLLAVGGCSTHRVYICELPQRH